LLAEPDAVATRVVAELLRDLWAPPAAGHPFRLLRNDAKRWAATVSASSAISARLRDETLDVLGWLAAGEVRGVVLHCDLHPGNVLRASRRPWLAIDPKPAVGDPAFDLAPVLRDRAAPGLVPARFAIVTEVTGLDPARVRGWALVQAVEGAAWSYEVGDVAAGADFTLAAECIAALRG
jgi:streptomycin 6-kinase